MPTTIDPAWLAALLARHGLRALRSHLVADTGCTVLRLWPDRGPELSLRIYPAAQSDAAAIDTELAWLARLGELGARVPCPLADRDGAMHHDTPDGRRAVLLTWVHGRTLDRALRPHHLRATGRLIAQMHDSADELAREGRVLTQRDADGPDLAAWARDERPVSAHWPRTAQAAAVRAARRLIDEASRWPQVPGSRGLLHGDLHPWNLLYRGRAGAAEAGAIDFSDCGIGWRALDFASALQYLHTPLQGFADHRARHAEMREQLLRGYTERRALWPDAEAQIDALRPFRWLNAIEWVLDCWKRPDERAFGPPMLRDAPRLLAVD